jgi:hypothetical protein
MISSALPDFPSIVAYMDAKLSISASPVRFAKSENATDNGTALSNLPMMMSSSVMISLLSGYIRIKSVRAFCKDHKIGLPALIATDIASSRSKNCVRSLVRRFSIDACIEMKMLIIPRTEPPIIETTMAL